MVCLQPIFAARITILFWWNPTCLGWITMFIAFDPPRASLFLKSPYACCLTKSQITGKLTVGEITIAGFPKMWAASLKLSKSSEHHEKKKHSAIETPMVFLVFLSCWNPPAAWDPCDPSRQISGFAHWGVPGRRCPWDVPRCFGWKTGASLPGEDGATFMKHHERTWWFIPRIVSEL